MAAGKELRPMLGAEHFESFLAVAISAALVALSNRQKTVRRCERVDKPRVSASCLPRDQGESIWLFSVVSCKYHVTLSLQVYVRSDQRY